MIRTQIYLTEQQRNELSTLAKAFGKKQSELIREAIDKLIYQAGKNHRKHVLSEAAGIWKDRTDLPDFLLIRSEWDRT
jgi:chromosome segregation and condensation protein ScpB